MSPVTAHLDLPLPAANSKTARALDKHTHAWLLLTTALAMSPLLLQLPLVFSGILLGTSLLVATLGWKRPLPAALRVLLVFTLLVALGWQMGVRPGRDSGGALLAAMLALKPGELHSLRDARSLLGFALFTPFAAFLLDQGPLTLALALLAVICTLLTLQQLASQETGCAAAPLRRQWKVVGRLLLVGLPLTLSAFWLLPRLSTPLWGVPDYAQAKPGLSDTMEPGTWLDLLGDDSPVLRAVFFGETPPPQQRYWRGPVLTQFDGRIWRRLRRPARYYPVPEVIAKPPQWDYRVEYEPSQRNELVALELPLEVPEGATLNADVILFSNKDLNKPTQWRMRAAQVEQFQVDLPPRLREQTLQLPTGFNPRTLALGQQWRSEAGEGLEADRVIVQRALEWMGQEFSYTLDTVLAGRHSADEFLFEQKTGFCEHFSSAFAILMRSAGIPARIVTGYVGGEYNRFGNYWLIRKERAHAWTEVWLPERGWVRADPTAAVAPERILDTLASLSAAVQDEDGGGGGIDITTHWQRLIELGDWLRSSWNTAVLSFDADMQQQLLSPFGVEKLNPAQLVGLFSALAAFALALMVWLLARGERQRDPLLRAWQRLCRRYVRLGLARQHHEPALQWAKRVEQKHPGSGLVALSQRFNRARYAKPSTVNRANLLRDITRHRPKSKK